LLGVRTPCTLDGNSKTSPDVPQWSVFREGGDVMRYLVMSGVREKKQRDVVLRPGIVIPVMGYLGSLGAAVGAVIVVLRTPVRTTIALMLDGSADRYW
jgi:hypothetical protein